MKYALAKIQYTWRCGRHSGFPLCCILWYLGPWLLVVFKIPKMWEWYWTLGTECDYVRCPMCLLTNRRVEVKDCDCRNGF